MINFSVFCFLLIGQFPVSSSLGILNPMSCSQPGIEHCKIGNCSDMVAQRDQAPTLPDWAPEAMEVGTDEHRLIPVLNVTWILKADTSIKMLRGSQIKVTEESTSQTLCVQFYFRTEKVQNPHSTRWSFSLDKVVVEPRHEYTVTVFNLPKPHIGEYRIKKKIIIPGCDNKRIKKTQKCQENGSLWDHNMTADASIDRKYKKLSIVVRFKTSKYSEIYQVSIQNGGFRASKNVSKENRTSLNVTFELSLWQLLQCKVNIMVQPFFVPCKPNCWSPNTTIDYCLFYQPRTAIVKTIMGLLSIGVCLGYILLRMRHKDPLKSSSSAVREQPDLLQVQGRKRVLLVYSCDHPLYKTIVLKLCAFLATKCGTEVVLDLLDSTRLGVLGGIQWLEWHRAQIESSSDKILILCSPGVGAKWRAMCGEDQVLLREDIRSPLGDMLTPSLSLMIPHFIRAASFKNYIVAYFDGVCSEEDIPSPLSITVRYKLMKQFEEVFFRILDTEKHEPGRVKQIEGLSEDKYHQCPSGRALLDAIKAFQVYQAEHPQWFEEEKVEVSELEAHETSGEICEKAFPDTNLIKYSVEDSAEIIKPGMNQETIEVYLDEKPQIYSFNHFIVEDMQAVLH